MSIQFCLHNLGSTKPGLRKEVGGSLTFFSPSVAGVFFIILFPNLAFDSLFLFVFGDGAGRDSNSKRFLTSSDEKRFPCGIVNLAKICSVCFSLKIFFSFDSFTMSSMFLWFRDKTSETSFSTPGTW